MNHNTIVRSLQAINHIVLIIGIIYVFVTSEYYWLLYSLFTYVVIGLLGVNVGYHRLLSHHSFKTYSIVEKILSFIGVITTIGSPMAWVAVHRQHHRAAETVNDPHSPYVAGKFNTWIGKWKVTHLEPKLIRDMLGDKYQKFLHKYYLEIIVSFVVLLTFANPLFPIFLYSIPACLCLHSTSAIIVIAHYHGYKTYKLNDESRNSWIAHLMSLGEGWHNNHHAKPYQWKQGEQWWEIDPPSWIIRIIKLNT